MLRRNSTTLQRPFAFPTIERQIETQRAKPAEPLLTGEVNRIKRVSLAMQGIAVTAATASAAAAGGGGTG